MSLGPAEILVILVVALLVLGPAKLPEAARGVGKAMAEFRRITSGFESEVREAFSEPTTPTQPPGSLAVIEPSVVPPTTPTLEGTRSLPSNPADAEIVLPPSDPSLS